MSPYLSAYLSAVLAIFITAAFAQQPLPIIPPRPVSYPPPSQLDLIEDAYLSDPLVADAYEYVLKTVNPTILALKPSKQFEYSNVSYPLDQMVSACYWGTGSVCVRDADTKDVKADIRTCPKEYQWGITYDDGPNGGTTPGTAELRQVLKENNIKATFFVLGSSVSAYGDELKNLYKDGHQIGIHTWTHHPMTSLTNRQIVAELKYTERIIYDTIGVLPLHWRPPYGDMDDRVRAIATALGYRTIFWTAFPDLPRDTQDTASTNQSRGITAMTNEIAKWFNDPINSRRGFISLEHDASVFTVSLAVSVIQAFKDSNSPLKPQPVSQCAGLPAYRSLPSTTPTATVPASGQGEGLGTGVIFGIALASGAIVLGFVGFLFLKAVRSRHIDRSDLPDDKPAPTEKQPLASVFAAGRKKKSKIVNDIETGDKSAVETRSSEPAADVAVQSNPEITEVSELAVVKSKVEKTEVSEPAVVESKVETNETSKSKSDIEKK